jgi:hypothetical protein
MTVMTEATDLSLSWSQVKVWQRCQKQWEYKYQRRLQAVRKSTALYLGSWVHKCLETHYFKGDWKIGHQEYVNEWNKLMDEERAHLSKKYHGTPLPQIVTRIMKSYLWYYRHQQWEVIAVEIPFEVRLKNNILINGIIDLIIKDENGLYWVIDHKTASNIPESGAFHAMDPQLMVYPWAAKKILGIEIAGVIYNYVKSKPPSIPQLTKAGNISKRKIVTDYPTAYRFLVKNGLSPSDYSEFLKPLRKKSPFLRRYRLPREKIVTKTVLTDFYESGKQIETIGHGSKRHIRNITKDCSKFCDYHDLCRGEMNGGDMSYMIKHSFTYRPKEDNGNRTQTERFEELEEA